MLSKMKNKMEVNKIDGFLITDIFNVRYLSGYTSDDAYLLLTKDKNYFLTDPRYTEQAAEECPEFVIHNWRDNTRDLSEGVAKLIKKENIASLGVEGHDMKVDNFVKLQSLTSIDIKPLLNVVEDLRRNKTDEEIEYLQKACQISDRVFERIIEEIKVGKTEKELSAKLAYFLKIEGSDARNYENIFISGPRTSLLHGIPSERKIQQGDLVLMDYGAGYKGYLSDMSRTVVIGKPTDKQKEIYEIIDKSESNMIDALKDDVKAAEIYEASLEPMKDTKYIDYHYPGIGHGVGLAVHEIPFLGANSKHTVRENDVITAEPGIYIPGWGGIRIEDQVVVTKTGCRVLTKASRQFLEL